jgi:hypothetical protein
MAALCASVHSFSTTVIKAKELHICPHHTLKSEFVDVEKVFNMVPRENSMQFPPD